MFVNNAATRHGHRAASQSSRAQNSGTLGVPDAFKLTEVRKPASKRKRHTTIGDNYSSGLVIQGSTEPEWKLGEDPDNTDPAMAGASLRDPDFPISYSGLGTMTFKSPVRIPTIVGNVHVQGSITQGDATDVTTFYSFVPTLSHGSSDTGSIGEVDVGLGANTSLANAWRTGDIVYMTIRLQILFDDPTYPAPSEKLYIGLQDMPSEITPGSKSVPGITGATIQFPMIVAQDLHVKHVGGFPQGELRADRIILFETFPDDATGRNTKENLTAGGAMNLDANASLFLTCAFTYSVT